MSESRPQLINRLSLFVYISFIKFTIVTLPITHFVFLVCPRFPSFPGYYNLGECVWHNMTSQKLREEDGTRRCSPGRKKLASYALLFSLEKPRMVQGPTNNLVCPCYQMYM